MKFHHRGTEVTEQGEDILHEVALARQKGCGCAIIRSKISTYDGYI
jgi:hypothetical protein